MHGAFWIFGRSWPGTSLKKIPRADITADDDGLWHTHESKPRGLLRWADIGRIRERAGQQCLEIFDRTGRKRIRVEYQLTGFEGLRNRLYENIRLSGERARGRDFSKNPGYHLFYWACGIGFSWLGLYIGQNSSPVLGFGGMSLLVMVLVYDYLKTVFRVEIRPQGLTVFYPLREQNASPGPPSQELTWQTPFTKGPGIRKSGCLPKAAKSRITFGNSALMKTFCWRP